MSLINLNINIVFTQVLKAFVFSWILVVGLGHAQEAPIDPGMVIGGSDPLPNSKQVIYSYPGDFSSTQGYKNWYYGFYDGKNTSAPYSPDDFEQFPSFTPLPTDPDLGLWHPIVRALSGGQWTMIRWDARMHPNGTNTNELQYSTLRWQSPSDGEISIVGTLAPANSGTTRLHIFVDNIEIYNQSSRPAKSISLNQINVRAGSFVDFAIDPDGSDVSDGTDLNVTINFDQATSNSYLLKIDDIEDVNLGEAFLVNVKRLNKDGSVDQSYSGKVSLRSSIGRINPSTIDMINGIARSDEMVFSQAVGRTRVKASQLNDPKVKANWSNPFYVRSDLPIVPATLEVKVEPYWFMGAFDITVYLRDSEGVIRSVTERQDRGNLPNFIFSEVMPGLYDIWAIIDEFPSIRSASSTRPYSTQIPAYTVPNTAMRTLQLVDTSQQPVLILPGMLGSTTGNRSASTYPRLSSVVPPQPSGTMKILDGPDLGPDLADFSLGYLELKDYLTEGGYAVYEVPWDWRMTLEKSESADSAWEYYLMPAIDNAKDPNNDGVDDFDYVHVVAHSMGGLLTRAYIQSDEYRYDIDKFVMVGTPNEGAVKAYMLVEGGDPYFADWGRTDHPSLYWWWYMYKFTYSKATEMAYRLMNDNMSPFDSSNCRMGLDFNFCKYLDGADNEEISRFFQEEIVTGIQLLPTYRFLGLKPGDWYLNSITNSFLINLNNDAKVERMMPGINPDSPHSSKVKTLILTSTAEETYSNLELTDTNVDPLYPDGVPNLSKESLRYVDGDGTVSGCSVAGITRENEPLSSEILCSVVNQNTNWATVRVDRNGGSHTNMLRNFKEDILQYFKGELQ